jgi:beta-glucanase (GH16 family)
VSFEALYDSNILSLIFPSYGKVTYEVSSPLVAGVVTAVILIGSSYPFLQLMHAQLIPQIADERDEIDVELLGGDPAHWQTNVFAPSPGDKQPLWGVFSSVEDVPAGNSSDATIVDFHKYSIEWSIDRIVWGVDGKSVRTLSRGNSTGRNARVCDVLLTV